MDQFAFVGETLRRLRKERGKTLEQIGEEAGLGRGQLSRIENSRQEATLGTLSKILTSQGVSRREFFRRYDLVEAEALANERASERASGGPGPDGPAASPERAGWPQEIQDVLGKVESFVQTNLHQPRPVAQGAFEFGEWVVLFRVLPKNAPETQDDSDDPKPRPPARRKGKR